MIKQLWIVVFLLMSSLHAEELSMMDSIRSKVLTTAVSMYFSSRGYGKVDNVTVDTTKKTLKFVLMPEGEKQPLNISFGSYMTITIDKEEYLVLQKVQTNRIWLNRIFADHMEEGIKVPLGTVAKGAGSLLLSI